MTTFHVNPNTGNPGACTARKGKCPFGENAPHFSSSEEARAHYEDTMNSAIFTSPKEASTQLLVVEGRHVEKKQTSESINKVLDNYSQSILLQPGTYLVAEVGEGAWFNPAFAEDAYGAETGEAAIISRILEEDLDRSFEENYNTPFANSTDEDLEVLAKNNNINADHLKLIRDDPAMNTLMGYDEHGWSHNSKIYDMKKIKTDYPGAFKANGDLAFSRPGRMISLAHPTTIHNDEGHPELEKKYEENEFHRGVFIGGEEADGGFSEQGEHVDGTARTAEEVYGPSSGN